MPVKSVRQNFDPNLEISSMMYGKLGKRQADRIRQRIHRISKSIVNYAKKNKAAIIFEDLNGIRKLYRRGNGQGNKFRRKLNSWSHYEPERQTSYKAAWDGVPFYKIDPRCTSTLCPACRGRLKGTGIDIGICGAVVAGGGATRMSLPQ